MADPTPTQTYINQVGFAPEIAPYAEQMLGQAAALTDTETNPYMQYQGERVAQFAPLQTQSYQNAALQGPAYQTQAATGLAGLAANKALGMQYNPSDFTASQVNAPSLNNFQMQGPLEVQTQNFTDAGNAGNYMNPYQQNVTDIQKREAQRQAGIADTKRGAGFASAGAFGGSRQAIENAEAQRNLGTQLNDIQAQGSNAAYQQAMAQFNADQARQLQAGTTNQQMGYNVNNANLQSKLGVQQLGSGQSLQAQTANQQANNAMNQLNEQSAQYGAGFGLQGAQTALTGANTLGTLGTNQYNQEMGINALQNQYGLQQQAQIQKELDNKYQDFQNYQNYPYKQLGFMSDIVRGVPLTTTGSSVYTAPPSTAQNIASLGLGAAGISKLFSGGSGSANGGLIGMAEGGMADGGAMPQMQYAHAFDNGSGYARGGLTRSGGIGALALNKLV